MTSSLKTKFAALALTAAAAGLPADSQARQENVMVLTTGQNRVFTATGSRAEAGAKALRLCESSTGTSCNIVGSISNDDRFNRCVIVGTDANKAAPAVPPMVALGKTPTQARALFQRDFWHQVASYGQRVTLQETCLANNGITTHTISAADIERQFEPRMGLGRPVVRRPAPDPANKGTIMCGGLYVYENEEQTAEFMRDGAYVAGMTILSLSAVPPHEVEKRQKTGGKVEINMNVGLQWAQSSEKIGAELRKSYNGSAMLADATDLKPMRNEVHWLRGPREANSMTLDRLNRAFSKDGRGQCSLSP